VAKAAPVEAVPAPSPAAKVAPAEQSTPEPATASASPEPEAAPPAEPAPASAPRPAPGDVIDAAALRRLWPDVLDVVKQSSRTTKALLDNAQVAAVDGSRLTLSAPSAPLAKMIGDDRNTEVLRTALTSIVGGSWQVGVEVDGAPVNRPPAATAATPAPSPAPSRAVEEPDPRDDTEPDDSPDAQRVDPEAQALSLLQSTLGARPLDEAG
jgi:DNA polymerase-3 subunit gamma/tau